MTGRVTVRHLGVMALCGRHGTKNNIDRVDLGASRYRRLGVTERFKGEPRYRVCKQCIAKLKH
jgi:hypothetical protein